MFFFAYRRGANAPRLLCKAPFRTLAILYLSSHSEKIYLQNSNTPWVCFTLPEPPFGTQKCVPRRFRSFSCFLFECSWSKKKCSNKSWSKHVGAICCLHSPHTHQTMIFLHHASVQPLLLGPQPSVVAQTTCCCFQSHCPGVALATHSEIKKYICMLYSSCRLGSPTASNFCCREPGACCPK